ncbi:MAG: ChaN family lipoprotein [Planctomycetes bacterium]|nr:ChaN family lipoprotein [Planctomycetota bacterium]
MTDQKKIHFVLIFVIVVGCLGLIACQTTTPPVETTRPGHPDRPTHPAKPTLPPSQEKIKKMIELTELHKLSINQLQSKQFDAAISSLEKIVRLEPKSSMAYYNMACVYSLQKETDQAIKSLRQAIDLDYIDADHIKTDSDLDNIRTDKRFLSLIKKITADFGRSTEEEIAVQKKAIAIIEKTRGLKFKKPLQHRTLELEQFYSVFGRKDESIKGFYRYQTKTLYVKRYKNPQKAYTLRIHESFHGWQDQYFDLKKLHAQLKTTDTNYVSQALIEGDASYMMIVSQPGSRMNGMLTMTPPWKQESLKGARLVDMCRKTFNYSVGASFIKTVHEAEGWNGVNKIYTNLPRSTEQILHPEKYLNNTDEPVRVNLPDFTQALDAQFKATPEDTIGEFHLMLELITTGLTGPAATKAATGWGGDRILRLEQPDSQRSFIWKTAWDTKEDAGEFFAAAQEMTKNMYPEATALATETEGGQTTITYEVKENIFALVSFRDKEVIILRELPKNILIKAAEALNVSPTPAFSQNNHPVRKKTGSVFKTKKDETITRLQKMTLPELYNTYVDLTTYEIIDFDTLTKRLKNTQAIYVGERHDNPAHHQLQLNILTALFKNNPDVAMGMEFLYRSNQLQLDDFTAQKMNFGKISPLIKKGFGSIYNQYKPLLQFCGQNKVKLVGLSAPPDIETKFAMKGWEGLTEKEKKFIAKDIDIDNKSHKKYVLRLFQGMINQKIMKRNDAMMQKFYVTQCVRDETMAESIANYLKENQRNSAAQIMIVAGGGHVEYKFNIPDRVVKRYKITSKTVIPLNAGKNTNFRGLFASKQRIGDFLAFAPPSAGEITGVTPKKPLLGIALDISRQPPGCLVTRVIAGLPAAQAGLQNGDVIMQMDSKKINRQKDLMNFMKTKKSGDKIALIVSRKNKQQKFIVKLK